MHSSCGTYSLTLDRLFLVIIDLKANVMALVDYSGSEASDEGENPAPKEPSKSKTASNKPAFQKVVDSSNPHKIRVSLPEPFQANLDTEEPERPTKRAKIESSGLSGFNALLPAPKRAAASTAGASLNGTRKNGLGAGVSLRTGAAPGFSREPEPSTNGTKNGEAGENGTDVGGSGTGPEQIDGSISAQPTLSRDTTVEEPKPKGNTTMFKPLSVARKPQKKKVPPLDGLSHSKPHSIATSQQAKTAAKISLFSTGEPSETASDGWAKKEPYRPMVYTTSDPDITSSTGDPNFERSSEQPTDGVLNPDTAAQSQQSLDTIASDLNLSASAKRQLFGRQKNNASAVNIVKFNIDEEYKANEAARQSGEQVQHNPVRAIAPGKHSLKQLVNMGTNQADALEESFASGRRNRSEAGSKYGW